MSQSLESRISLIDCDGQNEEIIAPPSFMRWLLPIGIFSIIVIEYGSEILPSWFVATILVVPFSIFLYCLVKEIESHRTQLGTPADDEQLRREIREWQEGRSKEQDDG